MSGYWLATQIPMCRCGDKYLGAYSRRESHAIMEMRGRNELKTRRYRCSNGNAWHLGRTEKEEQQAWEELADDLDEDAKVAHASRD